MYGVDAGRIVCAFLVVLLHLAQYTHAGGAFNTPVQIICRVAVPFFFIASGYFLRVPTRFSAAVVMRPLRRIGTLYIFWALAYLAVFSLILHAPTSLRGSALISGGRAFQLWFLPALLMAMIVVQTGWITLGRRGIGLLCLAAAVLGTALMSYVPGISVEAKMFARLLCAPLFVYLGMYLAQVGQLPRLRVSVAIMLAGLAGILAEEYLVARISGQALTSHDLLTSTYVYGAGAFLTARQLAPTRLVAWLGRQGRFALGIYIIQLFFLILLGRSVKIDTLPMLLVGAAAVFLLTYAVSVTMSLVPGVRRLIT